MTKHTLEMDADTFACTQLLHEVRANEHSPLLMGGTAKLKTLLAAIYIPLRSFDRGSASTKQLFDYSHPMGIVRFAQIGAWSQAYADKFNFLNREQCKELFVQCVAACEPLMRENGAIPFHPDTATFFQDSFGPYGEKILARWAKIRPQLEPHLLGGSLYPAQADPA
ncbi:hypothetical protein IVA88_21575 [Bradyrhizobium sp. 149]|uniref:hypothetical protein n=1 Tax=Bradyrhizobium sp. 149 TaxID=2782624 RepID=UPI001FF7B9C2|nr:hypothetical protein [Bradyrhizobium sp. 149]MCK1654009.1 hypothetical protein [Bradyrhizobium sp. 149]